MLQPFTLNDIIRVWKDDIPFNNGIRRARECLEKRLLFQIG